ncbi:Oxysterol-binding protein [Polychaeton citri CBS 116435]|uniref:Oxysterol-binding protein n=1 Tax=Polychaeton citri CBS 116435 TaxID=1314669 RepID=A0A9P4QH58_9PEZI|nr:Oxysterol-binding protein [Polychaeton citri CBS 116435]
MAETEGQRSTLKEFLTSIATIRGDLSNITAPPFVLADKSTTEFPRYWIEHPDLFCAPANESDPEKRALAVLKWFLSSLRGQQYAGRNPRDGVKKPLNAFLSEVFLGEIVNEKDDSDVTRLVSEQVSHHPPVTACYLWNEKHGVRAEGYTRQEITFTGSVNIQQMGHAVLHLDRFDEDYLVPLPNVKVKGILTGGPYPELNGVYHIVSSSGYVSEIDFTGKGFFGFGGNKNHVRAAIYSSDDKKHREPIFTAEGGWSDGNIVFKDGEANEIEVYDVSSSPAADFQTLPLDQQDPWESRNAWSGVIASVRKGDMQGVSDNKAKLENAQRELRKKPETSEENWRPLFFRKEKGNAVAEKLLNSIGEKLIPEQTMGIWRFDREGAVRKERPWRGDLTPFG